MKETELRINNHVQLIFPDGEITCIVEGIKWDSIALNIDGRTGWYESKDIEPITLTEQWLLDFGFESIEGGVLNKYIKKGSLGLTIGGFGLVYASVAHNTVNGDVYLRVIKHIHQLQNLYFAITREELILKEKMI